MDRDGQPFPDDCAKQWEVLLLLLAKEEKKMGISADCEVKIMRHFMKRDGVNTIFKHWLEQMKSSYADKPSDIDTTKKSDTIALYWRLKGNAGFKKSMYKECNYDYTKSLLYAEPNGEMYPLALANRSATLLHLKMLKDCLIDIKLALDSGYPKEQQYKLFLRQAECYISLNQREQARASLDLAKEFHDDALNDKPNLNAEFDRQLTTLEEKLKTMKDGETLKPQEEVSPNFLESENIDFVCASKSLVLREGQYGRHVVTEAPAQRGEYFFDEPAYAMVAIPIEDNLPVVCEMCFIDEMNAMPCKQCSRSIYCSEACRDKAWTLFHQFECVGSQITLWPTIGIAHLALRLLIVTADKGFPPIERDEAASLTVEDVFKAYGDVDKTQIYKKGSHEYYKIFNLVTNFNKMRTIDFLQYALTATMLVQYLEHHTSFFDYLQSRLPYRLSRDNVKLLSAALLLKHMGQLVCNGHSAQTMSIYIPSDDSFAGRTICEKELRYSTGIYPSAAMMNHSCDPNIVNTFYRDRIITRCTNDIPAGGELLNCYGPHKSRDTYKKRRTQLYEQYCFVCRCPICLDVDRRDFAMLFSAFVCLVCKGPVLRYNNGLQCKNCKATGYDVERAGKIMERAEHIIETIKRGPREQYCDKLAAVLKLKQQVLHKNNYELRQTVDDLARFYAEKGEYGKCIDLLKQNIQCIEYHYGPSSVEVAHEMRKLSEIMFERIMRFPQQPNSREWCLETIKVLKKAILLMELNYGTWREMVRHLREQEQTVLALARYHWPDADSLHEKLYNLNLGPSYTEF